jgi:hypothetical protein
MRDAIADRKRQIGGNFLSLVERIDAGCNDTNAKVP